MGEEQKYIGKWCRADWSREVILERLLTSGVGRARSKLKFNGLTTHTEPLLAVGDKCGWDAVNEYRKRGEDSDILTRFGSHMDMPVKTIVTLRHPLDNISCWMVSPKYIRMYGNEGLRFRRMIRRYKRFHDAAWDVLEGQDVFYLHNEELIANPSPTIQALSDWLELPPNKNWRRACAKRVFKSPNRRRDTIKWPEVYEQRVMTYIDTSPMFEYYRQ
jgi:hypothetical protein